MTVDKTVTAGISSAPAEVLSDPALLFLYYRIEQILGIKAGYDALKNLNNFIETTCGASFIKDPASYEHILTSREQIFDVSKFITINETYFFREGIHFDVLLNILPELSKLNRPLQICCAAVSIGCEAYSIAMLIDFYYKNKIDFSIDAFDIDNDVIENAKNARYTSNTLRSDGIKWKHILDQYLIPGNNDEYTVSKEIRSKVNFFPHNIMRGIEKKYDIIFFRNALIYFSSKNRITVINNLYESLYTGGYLFLGVSEVSSIKHPLLENLYSCEAFYFRKISDSSEVKQADTKPKHVPPKKIKHDTHEEKPVKPIPPPLRRQEQLINCSEILDLLKTEDGKPNAESVFSLLDKNTGSLSVSMTAAAVIYYLNIQDFNRADLLLINLEKHNSEAFTRFLRGEYFYLKNNSEDALNYYQEAATKNKLFWPAFYRIAVLSSEGNRVRYEYKIKKAIESIELSRKEEQGETHYECFMGGFSSDYFLRILEKKLA